MKYLFSFVICCIVSGAPRAQSAAALINAPSKWAVRFNAFGLIDLLDGNVSAGAEYTLHAKWSLTTDLSYILYSGYLPDNRSTSGYIIKPAVRYYTSVRRNRFLEATLFYKHVNYRMEDWLNKDVVNGVPAFEEFQEFVFRKRVAGVNVQAGIRTGLSKDKLLSLEGYVGFGVRFRWQDIKDEPRALYQPGVIFFDFQDPYRVLPSFPCALRLVYCIR